MTGSATGRTELDLHLRSPERQAGSFVLLDDFQQRFLSRPVVEQLALSEATADEAAAIAKKHGYVLAL